MIRECYRVLKSEEVSPIESIWEEYLAIKKSKDDEQIKDFITSIDVESLKLGNNSNALVNAKGTG